MSLNRLWQANQLKQRLAKLTKNCLCINLFPTNIKICCWKKTKKRGVGKGGEIGVKYKLTKYDETSKSICITEDSTEHMFLEMPRHSRMASKIKHNGKTHLDTCTMSSQIITT